MVLGGDERGPRLRIYLAGCPDLKGLDTSRFATDDLEPEDPGTRHNFTWLWTTYDHFQTYQGDNIWESSWQGFAWISHEDVAEFFGDWNSREVKQAVSRWLDHEVEGLNRLPEVEAWQRARRRWRSETMGATYHEVVARARAMAASDGGGKGRGGS